MLPEPYTPMLTKRTTENLGTLHPVFQTLATDFVQACNSLLAPKGYRAEVISGLRSWQAQAALYEQGRSKPGRIVTKARPGSSWHNYGLAIDLGLFKGSTYLDEAKPAIADHLYRLLEPLAKERGMEWAGTWKSFPETPHFQKTYGHTLASLRAQMAQCGYDATRLKIA